MHEDDTGDKKVDPIVVQSLEDFKYNCKLLESAVENGAFLSPNTTVVLGERP